MTKDEHRQTVDAFEEAAGEWKLCTDQWARAQLWIRMQCLLHELDCNVVEDTA